MERNLKIQGVRRVTCRKIHAEDPQILDAP